MKMNTKQTLSSLIPKMETTISYLTVTRDINIMIEKVQYLRNKNNTHTINEHIIINGAKLHLQTWI